ncbi:MAG: hypothetical protein U1E65_15100 [Myxococcota bacterium]
MSKRDGLPRLAEEIAAAQAERLDDAIIDARARLFEVPDRRPAAWTLIGAASLAMAASLIGWLWLGPESSPVRMTVEGAAVEAPSAWVSAPADRALPFEFSDGTEVFVSPLARARLAEATAKGGRFAVERGRVSASVAAASGAEWRFEVGPFTLEGKGTRFDAGWDAPREVFELAIREGSVELTGPTIVGLKRVGPGEQLRIALAPEPPPPRLDPTPTVAPASPPAPSMAVVASPKAIPPPKPSPPRWRDALAAGRFEEGLALVPDFDATCRGASAEDLLLLADAARFTGRAAASERAYRLLRDRFPGTRAAAQAAFALGRARFEAKDDRVSIRWLELYLLESPDGTLEPEALGRILEAEIRSGALEEAKVVARRYVARFPAGPQAASARKLLEPER